MSTSRFNLTRWVVMCLFLSVLIACGGSSGSSSPNAKVSIAWPDQTRIVVGPTYAASARITLAPTDGSTPIIWTVNRPAGTGQSISNTVAPSIVSSPAVLTVIFFSGANCSGLSVAVASINVMIGSDGTLNDLGGAPIGNIGYLTQLTSLQVQVSDLAIGAKQQVFVVGKSLAGVVALPQKRVDILISSGGSHATLSKDFVTGVSAGTTTVHVTFDTLSADATFNVVAQTIAYTRIPFVASHVAWDPHHNKLWGTFPASSPHYPNAIVDLDLTTGAVGNPITLPSEPDQIGISADGTMAYVGINPSKGIQVVFLNNRTLGALLDYSSVAEGYTPNTIQVDPTNPNRFAVGLVDTLNAPHGPYVYQGGAFYQPSQGLDVFRGMAWQSGTEIIRMTDSTLTRFGVTTNSVDILHNVDTGQFLQGKIRLGSTRIVLDDGRMFASTTFQSRGQLSYGPESYAMVETDGTANVAWLVVRNSSPLGVRAFDLASSESIGLAQIPKGNEQLIELRRFGAKGLAVLTDKAVYAMPTAPGL